jgi:hypothetical protein
MRREYFWAIVGALAGVVGVIVSVAFFFSGRSEQARAIGVELISRSVLVDEHVLSARQGRLQVLYDGKEIPNYAILQFRVSNTGNQPIRSVDYEENVGLHFWDLERVLSVEEVSADPGDVSVTCNVNGDHVAFSNVLLNSGDSYVIETRVVPEPGRLPGVEATGRVAGVKRIGFKDAIAQSQSKVIVMDSYRPLLIPLVASTVVMLVAIVLQSYLSFRRTHPHWWVATWTELRRPQVRDW